MRCQQLKIETFKRKTTKNCRHNDVKNNVKSDFERRLTSRKDHSHNLSCQHSNPNPSFPEKKRPGRKEGRIIYEVFTMCVENYTQSEDTDSLSLSFCHSHTRPLSLSPTLYLFLYSFSCSSSSYLFLFFTHYSFSSYSFAATS